ncbi:MAG TPA: hypothetical protein VGO34_15625 [Alphaproteobacteria bacterium]|jgi:hypothetical protein
MLTILSDVPAHDPHSYETPDDPAAFVARGVDDTQANDAFVIETAEIAAGVIVRQKGGYRFFASSERFQLLDGSVFKSPKAAQDAAELMQRAAARDLASRRRSEAASFLHDLPWS